VVEPTISGIHDLQRALGTVDHFGVPALVCINKADLNPERVASIEAFCAEEQIDVIGRVPFDTVVTEAMVQAQPVTTYRPDVGVSAALRSMWSRLREKLEVGP